jgi:DNA-binding MarR family transcriptional regulator
VGGAKITKTAGKRRVKRVSRMQQQEVFASDAASLTLLMNSVIARISRETFKDLSELGLNVQSARVLILLLERNGLRCSALARHVGLEATALSHLLRLLADQGLVTRERVKEDNRAVEVRLTPKGLQLARTCRSVDLDKQRILLKGVDPRDIEHFTALLSRMSDNLNEPRERNGG